MHSQTVRVNGHTVKAYTKGLASNKPAFVLIHGIGVSHRYFKRLMIELASTHMVVALDLPGFGNMARRPKHALSITELAEIAAAAVAELKLVQPILIGHSMGCQIITKPALSAIASKLILISPTVNPAHRSRSSHFVRLMRDGWLEPKRLTLLITRDYVRCGVSQYLQTLEHMLSDTIEKRLPNLLIPVLVIRGSRDSIVPADWVATVVRLSEGTLVEIPGAAHAPQYSHASKVSSLCKEFTET